MNRLFTLTLLILLAACGAKTDSPLSLERYTQVNGYLKEKDFFKARDTFEYYKPEIGKPEKFILEAFIDNAFNKPESSNKKIDEVFNGYAQQVNDSGKQQLLEIQQGNYARLYEYEKANGIVKEILDKYSGVLSKDQIE